MECNRDEALRVKEIAEKKFAEKDIAGAKKFALKAQNLYQPLEGIGQMIATLDVYLAAETTMNGEKDWYSILSIDTSADEDMMKKLYRKLALQLHPDKNKSVGAEGAFKLISEAWSVLSDKNRRSLYDQKRGGRCFPQRVSQPQQERPVVNTTNCFDSQQRVSKPRKDRPVPNSTSGSFDFQQRFPQPRQNRPIPNTANCSFDSQQSVPQPQQDLPVPNTINRSFDSQQRISQPRQDHSAPNATNSYFDFQQRVSQPSQDTPVPNITNSFDFTKNFTSVSRGQNCTTNVPSFPNVPLPSRPQNPDTFWTLCSRCRMQFEYPRKYLNHNLLCTKCQLPFIANEIAAPIKSFNSSNLKSDSQERYQNEHKQNSYSNATTNNMHHTRGNIDTLNIPKTQKDPFSRSAGAACANASSATAAQSAYMVDQTFEKLKKGREESHAVKKEAIKQRNQASKRASGNPNVDLGCNVSAKKQRGSNNDTKACVGDVNDWMAIGKTNGGSGTPQGFNACSTNKFLNVNMTGSEINRANARSAESDKTRWTTREAFNKGLFKPYVRNLFIERAKAEIHKRLEDWKVVAADKLVETENAKNRRNQKENDTEDFEAENVVKDENQQESEKMMTRKVAEAVVDKPKKCEMGKKKQISVKGNSELDAGTKTIEPVGMAVVDPDFHDFDGDRSERSFQNDQIWATYDEEDGMPRYYVLVQKVISRKPFKLRASYLTCKSNSEFGTMNWVSLGFSKTSGNFRISRYENIDNINIFSHKVSSERCPRGFLRIIPKKGDVWALYRNWSPDWDEHTPDDVIFKYNMVEVLDDYFEENGVPVHPLVKVPEFRTVFQRHPDVASIIRITQGEMFRFSHQVPAYLLNGEEGENAPRGCLELDPAAVPLELLQVSKEAKDEEAMAGAATTKLN